jgi:hypothetical protein
LRFEKGNRQVDERKILFGGFEMFEYVLNTKHDSVTLLLDLEDAYILEKYTLHYNKKTHYIRCYSKEDKTSIYLHRLIGNIPKGMVGDHINGNVFDNRRQNIQAITQAENCQKKQKHKSCNGKPTSSPFKCNQWDETMQKWNAYIRAGGHKLNLGYYENPLIAAEVYNIYAQVFFEKWTLNDVTVSGEDLKQVDFSKLHDNAFKNLTKHDKHSEAAKLGFPQSK